MVKQQNDKYITDQVKKKTVEGMRKELQGVLSEEQLDKIEEIFYKATKGLVLR